MQVPLEHFSMLAGNAAVNTRTADSGNVLATSFCSGCGSTLFADNTARPRVRTVHIGSLDDPTAVEVAAHIWVKQKLQWMVLPGAHRKFNEAGDWTSDYSNDPSRYGV